MGMNINISFYNDNFEALKSVYNGMLFEDVNPNLIGLLPGRRTALDIGCGTGRDLAALISRGFDVVGCDPSEGMRKASESTVEERSGVKCVVLNDSLPLLESVFEHKKTFLSQGFDVILLSAVYMHIELNDRAQAIETLSKLLSRDGVIYMTLRHGGFSDERKGLPVCFDALTLFAKKAGLVAERLGKTNVDLQGRGGVTWEQVVLFKENK